MSERTTVETSVPDADSSDLDLHTLEGLTEFRDRRWKLAESRQLSGTISEIMDALCPRDEDFEEWQELKTTMPGGKQLTLAWGHGFIVTWTSAKWEKGLRVYDSNARIYRPGPWVSFLDSMLETVRERKVEADRLRCIQEIARLRAELGLDGDS